MPEVIQFPIPFSEADQTRLADAEAVLTTAAGAFRILSSRHPGHRRRPAWDAIADLCDGIRDLDR